MGVGLRTDASAYSRLIAGAETGDHPQNPSMIWLAILTLLFWLGAAWEIMRGNRRLRRLATLDAPPPAHWPRVSLVLAARNEGRTLGAALPTMLALDYPELELIAVNDRSEDDTGAVLEKIAATDPRLRAVHVRELPAGWLGKNHALHIGAQQASGEWILFTDADIHFAPDVLRRAIAHAEAQQLDHLAAVPQLHERGHALGICVSAFSLLFALFMRPWRVPDPASACHGGVGAFNLVRAATYRRLGGHAPIRLRPDDDMKLGKLMKSGGRSEIVLGVGVLSVAWYASVGELIRGLEKNAFAGLDYRVWATVGAVIAHGVVVFWPLAALFAVIGVEWWLNFSAVAVMLLVASDNHRFDGGRAWHALFLPVGVAVLNYIMVRSMVLTFWRGGIVWRGTHYSLRELRANRC
ncbi:glycosyltransferase [Oleiharenicola lentus]|uniref:glycosyltransferase n=1 Tax=Oleiharenicola lentus TaxID=2508720 RepID=UPI003F68219A